MNFHESENFDRNVYIIDENEIVEYQLRDLCIEYADETTTPNGIGARYHLREHSCGEVDLWTWGVGGSSPRLVESFENEEEANHALFLCHRYDLYNGDSNPIVYNTKAEAEIGLSEWLEEIYE